MEKLLARFFLNLASLFRIGSTQFGNLRRDLNLSLERELRIEIAVYAIRQCIDPSEGCHVNGWLSSRTDSEHTA